MHNLSVLSVTILTFMVPLLDIQSINVTTTVRYCSLTTHAFLWLDKNFSNKIFYYVFTDYLDIRNARNIWRFCWKLWYDQFLLIIIYISTLCINRTWHFMLSTNQLFNLPKLILKYFSSHRMKCSLTIWHIKLLTNRIMMFSSALNRFDTFSFIW